MGPLESLNGGKVIALRYRNRRIGEFLKELDQTEGRCTGIPKIRAAMERNGSPEPRFLTDEGQTHFLVELPMHQEFVGMLAHDGVQDQAHDGSFDLNVVLSKTSVNGRVQFQRLSMH